MKIFHTADWHLGKLVQSVYMTEDQEAVLLQLVEAVRAEQPDAVIIAGDLYDRAVPPTEAVALLDRVLQTIVLELRTPVLAIAGNHDSPSRLEFGSGLMQAAGLYMAGELTWPISPVVLHDAHGPVHFHLLPYADPAVVRMKLAQEDIRTHDDAMRAITGDIKERIKPGERHVLVAHAFVTPHGETEPNTSDSERPLSIGGAEHVGAGCLDGFAYVALGHLHQAHHVGREEIRYAGSPLKYSISEEHHHKGFLVVDIAADGAVQVEKRAFAARRDMRTVEGYIADIERQPKSEDYVFVSLLDEQPVLSPMERVRTVYSNAMHVERKAALSMWTGADADGEQTGGRAGADMMTLFRSFYAEAKEAEPAPRTEALFLDVLRDIEREDGERDVADSADDDSIRAV